MTDSIAINKEGFDKKSHLNAILKSLPNLPGVYKMLGGDGEILYVGKAKSLKNRVSSYFAKTVEHPKTRALVQRIHDIEIIIVRGETEALLLEQNLIKAHRPPYNIILRDDKSYLYVFMSMDKFPRLGYGRGKGKHAEGRFFGPYPSATGAKEALLLMQKLFMIRSCTNSYFNTRKRPCLEYQIKRCKAPCVGMVSREEYLDDVKSALMFLGGENGEVQKMLVSKMEQAAEALNFEQAAFYRDRITMVSEMQARQAVFRLTGEADVFAINHKVGVTCIHVLTVRGGKVLGGKNYFPDEIAVGDKNNAERLAEFILSFYFQVSEDLPEEIIVSESLNDAETIAKILQEQFNKKTQIKHRTQKHRAEWLSLAKMNADNALGAKMSDYQELNLRFAALKSLLESVCDRAIDRVECFDISHTMGEAAVGSCVVFDSGGARKRDYRQYAIHDITGGDDYAAMRQVLTRRYTKHDLPDLLLIDGGKGQLNVAKEVLDELGKLDDTLLVSVAKGEGRKAGLEVLHFLDHEPIDLPMDNKALHLIMHIRDEAHRFAITSHRKKRDKSRGSSVLEVIPGLGEKRRRELLTHFGGMQQLLSASELEIASVKGIGKVLAGTIYKALHA
ncbi:excinuclease ABC subunit UvrC [Moraxella sp. Tifton1]|uniref:UvrABC system protein C n=1 Tax=Moraxella oculi TaxID=2940516 RepID=A0ABW8U4X0_9GAMM|nr:excinuclease ABC subunit UvrC [Moraxella sp. Tifton1]MCL1623303.1 excinuclease ABC subunit UvrC [Moraxella sp. Tifton1]